MFSLGNKPHQEIKDIDELVSLLATSHRLPYPDYSNDEIYDIMKDCWQSNKEARPRFNELKQRLSDILGKLGEDEVPEHRERF